MLNFRLLRLAALLLAIFGSLTVFAAGFDPETATKAYLDTLQGEARERSDNYFEGGYWIILWATLVVVLVEGIFLVSGLSAKVRALAERITKRAWLVPVLYAIPYVLITTLLALPWTLYSDYSREKKYDLMNLSLGGFLAEQVIATILALIAMMIFFAVLFMVIRRAGRRWWIWGTVATTVLLLIGMIIAPVYIAPLFNEYTAMEDGPLRDRILAMSEAEKVPADNVYVFDQSKQHDRISANVSGLFGTMRISLNDNLLNRSTPEEVEAVMGHELGHYVLHHGFIGVAILIVVFGFGLFLVARIAPAVIERKGAAWGIRDIADPAVLPVFSIILAVYFFFATPVINSMVRTFENQADAFGLDVAGQPDGFASVSMKLSQYRKIEPSALEEFLMFDHPSGRTRVMRAMQWKADNVENPQMVVPDKPE